MNLQQMIPVWSAGVLTALWCWQLIKANRVQPGTKHYAGFWLALLSWPFLLLGELWQLAAQPSPWLTTISLLALPLILWGLYDCILNMLWRKPYLLRWPFALCGVFLVGLVVTQGALYSGEWQDWSGAAPVGQPIRFWAVYVACLIAAFLFLYISILLIEQVQQYHHELPLQVVDTHIYRLKGVIAAGSIAIGIAFFMVVLVAAVAFGLMPVHFWLLWFHIAVALALLILLSQFSQAQKVSPSPFDHKAMAKAPKMTAARAQAILKQAEAAVISQKAYKEIGLTLQTFADQSGLSASDICLALLATKKLHFRAFIYQFRMKYAKQILMSTDTKLDRVTKRLKLGANGTASHTFLKYLEGRR